MGTAPPPSKSATVEHYENQNKADTFSVLCCSVYNNIHALLENKIKLKNTAQWLHEINDNCIFTYNVDKGISKREIVNSKICWTCPNCVIDWIGIYNVKCVVVAVGAYVSNSAVITCVWTRCWQYRVFVIPIPTSKFPVIIHNAGEGQFCAISYCCLRCRDQHNSKWITCAKERIKLCKCYSVLSDFNTLSYVYLKIYYFL